MDEIIERALSVRNHELELEGIAVETDLVIGPSIILADPHQLQQAILNLLINAEQSILGAARQGRIRICTRRMPDSRLRLEN
jgi:signal transduction histidine kinase